MERRLAAILAADAALQSFISKRHEELASRGRTIDIDTIATLTSGFQTMWRREKDWQHLASGLQKAGSPD